MTDAMPTIVFDVNETLSDMAPMGERFSEIGAPAELAKLWFATLLRDGFALTASGQKGSFTAIGAAALRGLLTGVRLNRPLEAAVEHVIGGMTALNVHRDVPDGIRALAAGFRLITLSNGSAQIAGKLLTAAGIRDEFQSLLSLEDAAAWKPARASYDYAATTCEADPADMVLVAVHPWDIHGAARAGLRTAWLNRDGGNYPIYFQAPDFTVTALTELPEALAAA
ncbi:haloacid dehalogenase type II [Arthrobacter sp. AL12]|uniref:haloacid dehalogenase type II n=1 Tax=Arthrobacter sp. AL12 TaxID=3042241 RepID=UPI002499CC7F|nr:haloacid dehalogenase type II [Arthrobacter sp. AL12]MDI3214039.1 haloacid dehalogenase type II [Arthrobacter sp. AL12]